MAPLKDAARANALFAPPIPAATAYCVHRQLDVNFNFLKTALVVVEI